MTFNYTLEIAESSRPRYRTKIYDQMMRKVNKQNIEQMPYEKALEWFFDTDRLVPIGEKKSIKEIIVIEEDRIFAIFAGRSDEMFNNLEYIVLNTGWYFYITGLKLGKDKITEFIDQVSTEFKKSSVSGFDFDDFKVTLTPIQAEPNFNCYLLKILEGDSSFNILLDAGLDDEHLKYLRSSVAHLNLVFISHAHFDHVRGLIGLLEAFPKAIIISSRTTLEYFILYNWYGGEKYKSNISNITQLAYRFHFVKNNSEFRISEDFFIKFINAGHLPGALMLYLKLKEFDFVFTGDYCLNDYFPISGALNELNKLPKKINFCLMDGAFSSHRYRSPSKIFNDLLKLITLRIERRNRILIAADYGSTALVLFFTIYNYFRGKQRNKGLDANRPTIHLSEDIRRFFQIMTHNKDDLHPYIQDLITQKANPFQSGIVHWIRGFNDLEHCIREIGGIFILPDCNLNNRMTQNAFRLISRNEKNMVYLCGALRSEPAIELASGNNNIIIDGEKIVNRAHIWNVEHPDIHLNLHADGIQLEKFFKQIHVDNLCLFQQDPRKLIPVRNYLKEKYDGLNTSALYASNLDEMEIYLSKKK